MEKKHYAGVKAVLVIGASLATAAPAFAQSSVTLYGIVDNGIGYQSSSTTLGSTTASAPWVGCSALPPSVSPT